MLKEQIEQDLKQALLSGNKAKALTLRSIKSAILYVEVAKGTRDKGLSDEEIVALLSKEAKKRQESADFYEKGNAPDRAAKELAEKAIIEAYLPQQLSNEQLVLLIDQAITEVGASRAQALGQVIGLVKQRSAGQADGSRIAAMVKERLG